MIWPPATSPPGELYRPRRLLWRVTTLLLHLRRPSGPCFVSTVRSPLSYSPHSTLISSSASALLSPQSVATLSTFVRHFFVHAACHSRCSQPSVALASTLDYFGSLFYPVFLFPFFFPAARLPSFSLPLHGFVRLVRACPSPCLYHPHFFQNCLAFLLPYHAPFVLSVPPPL